MSDLTLARPAVGDLPTFLSAFASELQTALDEAYEELAAADQFLTAIVELLEDQGDYEPDIREAEDDVREANVVFEDAALAGIPVEVWSEVTQRLRAIQRMPERLRRDALRVLVGDFPVIHGKTCDFELPENHRDLFLEHCANLLSVSVEWISDGTQGEAE